MDLLIGRRTTLRAQLLMSLALAAAFVCVTAQPASAAAIVDLPGCTATALGANDDGSTELVPIGFSASFFGTAYTQLYVNNNGNVTFDNDLGQFTPFDFSISGNVIIAPFLADVDTRGAGSNLVTYGQTTYDGQPAFCVNWKDVGYYSNQFDKLNSFQLLLVKRGNDGAFDIVFNYDKVTWETGSASGGSNGFGGTPAAWGFANGDGDEAHFFVGPGSFTSLALLDGGPAALIAGSRGTAQPGRYIFQVTAAGLTGPKLTGTVFEPGGGDPVAFAPVQICPTGGGACLTRTTNSSGVYQAFGLGGSYNLTAFPPPDSGLTPGRVANVAVNAGNTPVTQNIELGPNPAAPPDDTSITNIGTSDGVPVAYWNDPLTLTTQGCTGGTATYELRMAGNPTPVRSGPMAEGPAGTYTATIAPLIPNSGDGVITVDITCPVPGDNESFDFGIYIDPSGHVRNSLGAPVEGATVVLLRAGTPTGTFAPVPDGSAVMSPANRRNPDETTSDGRFGWDVVAGYYMVRASKSGCVSNANRSSPFAESRVMTIPPPVTDLDLRLYCGEGGTTPPPPVPPPPPDRVKPNLTLLKVSPKTFKAGGAATVVAAAAATGSKFTFRLSERATVVLTIARKTTGRKIGKSCLKQSRSNRRRKPCVRYVTSGKLTRRNLPAGNNSVKFSGRIGTRKLGLGSYRVRAVPTDPSNNKGTQRTATFRIVRR